MFLNATDAKIFTTFSQFPNYEPANHYVFAGNAIVLGKLTLNCI